MASPSEAVREAVLLTGVYGSGKTTVAAELAGLLEARGLAYAAVDLDWLTWYDVGDAAEHDDPTMLLANLAPMVDNYLEAGVRWFVLALAARQLDELRAMLRSRGVELRVVRLTAPRLEIARRLRSDTTTARLEDLRIAEEWLENRVGEGIEDITIDNDRAVGDVAQAVLDWLGWGAAHG